MKDTVSRYLANIPSSIENNAIGPVLRAVADRLSSQIFNTGGLAIKAGGSALAKTVNTVKLVAGGTYVSLAAADMPALTGLNIGAGKYNVAVFYCDAAGTTSVRFGTEGATAALVKFPDTPEGKAIIGFLLITYASAFTGGTTPLDTATTVYTDTVGAVDPSIIL